MLADEAAILLGSSSADYSAPRTRSSFDASDDDGTDADELTRRRGLRPRGRVVEDDSSPSSSGDGGDLLDLDALVAQVQRDGGGNSGRNADLPPAIDDIAAASEGEDASSAAAAAAAAAAASQRAAEEGGGWGGTSPDGDNEEATTTEAAAVSETPKVEYPPIPERRRMLPELLAAAGFPRAAETAANVEITNIITCNSESATEGSLYVCVPCEEDPDDEEMDGHFWADESAELGAVAVIASQPLEGCLLPVSYVEDTMQALAAIAAEFYDLPMQRLQTVALIGSHGKTTTAWLSRGVFEESNEVVGLIGDSEYSIGVDLLTEDGDLWVPTEHDYTLDLIDDDQKDYRSKPFRLMKRCGKYELPPATPDALHMQKTLAGIADRGGGTAIIEICPTLAADGRAAHLRPSILVFTNIDAAVAEADPQGSDAYIERISAMFENLDESQTAIINVDDPMGVMLARLVENSAGAQLLTYGALPKSEADISVEKMKLSIWETDVLVRTPVGRLEVILPLIGRYNVGNALAAIAIGLASGVKLVSIVAGIEAVDLIPGRTEIVDAGQPFPVIVDSARTPEQVGRLIDEVKEAGARRTILVVGCPGGSSTEYRAALGNMAHFKADVVFFTNDSPGLDPPATIVQDMVNGLPEEVLGRHAGSYYPWLQDAHRAPQWFEHWLLRYQSEVGRYIVEDRFSAIRVAIGLAKARDVVLVTGRGQNDKMEVWDGIPPPRSEEERAAGQARKAAAESEDSPEYQEEVKWEAVDEYYEEEGALGLPVQRGTIAAWFDDSVECRNAVARLAKNLNNLKDLDRGTIPWTRYPEERDISGFSDSMAMAEASSSGNLDLYLRNVGEEIRSGKVHHQVIDDEDEDEDDDEDDDGF